MVKVPSILVKKQDGEKVRQWLIHHSLLNQAVKIQPHFEWLILPMSRELSEEEKSELTNLYDEIQFEHRSLEKRESKGPKDLDSALQHSIPKELMQYIPKSFDIIGNLIVLEVPTEIETYEKLIGETILKLYPSITSIFKKMEPVKGAYRLRSLKVLSGENNTVTLHKENKCVLEVDIAKVYFSPRLATEHMRVSSMVTNGEKVLDMFAGIGPFTVLMAKLKDIEIYAIDLNPSAIHYLKRNVHLNKVEEKIKIFKGDAKTVLKTLSNQKFDRIIMNLPSKASEYLDVAVQSLKIGGIIHYYQFVPETEYPEKFIEVLSKRIAEFGREIIEILNIRRVRAYAPYVWHVGVDILVN